MTREDIIRLAREAGGSDTDPSNLLTIPQLIHFAALVAEAEREAILEHCEAICKAQAGYGPPPSWMQLMDFIRARGRE